MNQILVYKKNKSEYKVVFIIQFYISFILIICLFFYWLNLNKKESKEQNITNLVNSNAKLSSVFNINNENYFCELIINKINMRYFVYNHYSEDLLKILPCKYGNGELGKNGNICILGHNYFNDRFFSNINKLEKNDKIILLDMNNKKYEYFVCEKFEISKLKENDVVNLNKIGKYLTLCTCTINENVRFVVRAKMN